MVNVIFDIDTGHDDAIALMIAMAYPEKINILGITTVAGNQTVDKVTDNTLKVLDYLNQQIPVAKGNARPIRRPLEVQPDAHGVSGMDGPNLPQAVSRVEEVHAVEFLRKTIEACQEKVTIISLAPMTNLAFFVRMYPQLLYKIEKIEMMGGSLYSGNIVEKAEFNIYHDPDAAKIVFESGIPIVMSGLEICRKTAIAHTDMETLKEQGKAAQLIYELLEFYCGYSKKRGREESEIFDMTPVFHILWPELFQSEFYHIGIETEGTLCRGMTVADFRQDRDKMLDTTEVLTEVKIEEYQKKFFESISRFDQILEQAESGTFA